MAIVCRKVEYSAKDAGSIVFLVLNRIDPDLINLSLLFYTKLLGPIRFLYLHKYNEVSLGVNDLA